MVSGGGVGLRMRGTRLRDPSPSTARLRASHSRDNCGSLSDWLRHGGPSRVQLCLERDRVNLPSWCGQRRRLRRADMADTNQVSLLRFAIRRERGVTP